MTLGPDKARSLVRLIQNTREREITCDECLAQIAEFIESQLTGRTRGEALRLVSEHLDNCAPCAEEYEVLRNALGHLETN